MVKIFKLCSLFIVLILINSCSFQNSGGFFESKIEQFEKEIQRKNSEVVFAPQIKFDKEISGVVSKNITKPLLIKKWTQNGLNHNNEVPNLYYKNDKNIFFKSKKKKNY